MSMISRRLLVWGGAAAIGTAGFAFMASNAVAASSVGQGSGTVSGYTVSNPQYVTNHYDSGSAGPGDYLNQVSFTLTSDSATAPANAEPSEVMVYTTGANGMRNSDVVANGYGWAKTYDPNGTTPNTSGPEFCQINNWTVGGSGAGTGKVTCVFYRSSTSMTLAKDIYGLTVVANN